MTGYAIRYWDWTGEKIVNTNMEINIGSSKHSPYPVDIIGLVLFPTV